MLPSQEHPTYPTIIIYDHDPPTTIFVHYHHPPFIVAVYHHHPPATILVLHHPLKNTHNHSFLLLLPLSPFVTTVRCRLPDHLHLPHHHLSFPNLNHSPTPFT
ncbi:unnamed protein product [Lactuca virosa]|uniref:Uncharacterized protein n=1 Tax=Lactuca virosa TaxID=75947 RepID=A0AAU9N9T3_9ASTR|nr:unnamed protein product [Lactuca virosa]